MNLNGPANIMFTQNGRVKVLDFGLANRCSASNLAATISREQLTPPGTVIGTPHYMSPEQVCGAPLDHRSDLFSLGILLCEPLTGKHPFRRGSPMETMTAILRDPPTDIFSLWKM